MNHLIIAACFVALYGVLYFGTLGIFIAGRSLFQAIKKDKNHCDF